MARLGNKKLSSSKASKSKSKSNVSSPRNSNRKVLEMEMEYGEEEEEHFDDEDEEEASFLPKGSSSSSGRNNGSNKNRNRKKRFGKASTNNDEDNNGNDSSSSSFSCSLSGPKKKLLVLLFVLVSLVVIFITQMDKILIVFGEYTSNGSMSNVNGEDIHHSGLDKVEIKGPRQDFHGQSTSNTFGGINNLAHPGGAKAASNGEGIAFAEIEIPKPNVGHAVPSLNRPNLVNSWGHYVHDEHRSPYASHLYDTTKEELQSRQDKYVAKMKKVRETWGYWNFKDPLKMIMDDEVTTTTTGEAKDNLDEYRSVVDFSGIDYKDLNTTSTYSSGNPDNQFPLDSWQADEEYVTEFLKEAKALVKRVKEGIYTEYGWPTPSEEESTKEPEVLENHHKLWKIHKWIDTDCFIQPENIVKLVCNRDAKDGIATFHQNSWDGLVRKLLHAMMTNDDFYAVLGGHSAAAGHGNDFQQNRIIHGFHHLMEPVMNKLGIRLTSRNMGMGGVGTLQFTLGGGDLYGEADIIEWDSGMTEKGPTVDLFNKQAILSGERVPLIISDYHFNLMAETKNTGLIGKYVNEKQNPIFQPETTFENSKSKPYASRWMNQKEEKYNAVCWEPRNDFIPLKLPQKEKPGSQVGWHPGNRQHTWSGRKLALVLLEGLEDAFDVWEIGIQKKSTTDNENENELNDNNNGDNKEKKNENDSLDSGDGDDGGGGCPLHSKYWHVGPMYKEIRKNLRTHITTPGINDKEEDDDIRSDCEKLIPWLPRICRVQMHGFGMWNPRAHIEYDLLNIIHEAPNGYKPDFLIDNSYDGFDLLPLLQELPDDDIDVHAIAIATSNPEPTDIDHNWVENDENEDDISNTANSTDTEPTAPKPPSRRWLQRASEIGFRKGSELFMGSAATATIASVPPVSGSNFSNKEEKIPSTTSDEMENKNSNNRSRKNMIRNRKLQEDGNVNDTSVTVPNTTAAATTTASASTAKKTYGENDIVPGRGWILHGWSPVRGFCDGSPQSECNRGADNDCLLSGANDKHYDVMGNSLSGWLVFTVPKVREGIILIRMEWWCGQPNELTKDWTEVNGGNTFDTTPWNSTSTIPTATRRLREHSDVFYYGDDKEEEERYHRKLKPTKDQLIPKDLEMDYAINGVIKTMGRDEWEPHTREYVKNVAVWPMLNDESMAQKDWDGEPVEVAVRFRSKINPQQNYCISHVYYA